MSKFGLEGFNKSIALDLAKYGIRSVSVAPTKTIVNQSERSRTKKRLSLIKKKIPLRKFSTTKYGYICKERAISWWSLVS